MTDDPVPALRSDIVRLGRRLCDLGLAPGSSGNISARLPDGRIIMTPTNSRLGDLEAERLSVLAADGGRISGDPPSKEEFLHRAVYDARPGAHAIVHLHATHSAAVSCMDGLDPSDCLPPLTAYHVMKVGRLPLIPYHRPGDPALAGQIGSMASGNAAILLANHGPIVAGKSLAEAANAIEELEETAKLFLLLRGTPTRPLNAAQIDELHSVFGTPGGAQ